MKNKLEKCNVSYLQDITKFNFKKTTHQFFPVDSNYLVKKFINYWKPSLAIFIDSEIWPNMLINLKKKSIQADLKKSFVFLQRKEWLEKLSGFMEQA